LNIGNRNNWINNNTFVILLFALKLCFLSGLDYLGSYGVGGGGLKIILKEIKSLTEIKKIFEVHLRDFFFPHRLNGK
jgi:hypothetical protein